MTRQELIDLLNENEVPERWYSLTGELKPDACIIGVNHSQWEFFYQDEKGNTVDYTVFQSESDAYDYLWKQMEDQLKFFTKYSKKI